MSGKRKQVVCLMLLAACAALFASAAQASLAADSLAALSRHKVTDSFSFIVWGDNRCRAGALGSPAFSRIIREANALAPAFTVGVGDLIPGAREQHLERTRAQWTDFIAAAGRFGMPCLPAVGNHDVDGPSTWAMYEELIGPRRYAFDLGGCRFIVLDSETGLDADQFQWLSERLSQPGRPRHVFLFLHNPLFYGAPEVWEPVHLLLRRFPVRAVFAGHEHRYSFDARDGIKYVVTGGAGAPLRDPPEQGGFYHYVIVNVRGDDVSLAVVKDGAILPSDCVRWSDFPLIAAMLTAVEAPQVEAPAGQCTTVSAAAKVRNSGTAIWEGAARWRGGGGWQMEPKMARFSLAPGEEVSLPFTIHLPGPLAARYPLPELAVDYAPAPGRTLAVAKPLRLRNLLRCPRAEAFQGTAAPVPITPPDFFPAEPQDLSAAIELRWDPQALHALIEVADDIARHDYSGEDLWQDDSVQLFFDMANDGNARGRQGDDHEFCAGEGARGVEVWRYAGPPDHPSGAAPGVACDISERAGRRSYHLTIPWRELAPFEPRAGAAFGLSVVVNDDDGLEAGGLTWVELTPGAGSGRIPFPLDRVVLE